MKKCEVKEYYAKTFDIHFDCKDCFHRGKCPYNKPTGGKKE